ncbi:hypothetical protein P0R31_10885 [Bradyrhizobium yuanmingense]|uniref:hypothetical protein n=1 Tax=Bradyrhizobium yuanmingense TaxID=108015 RepID=UPI0023BA023F|nr:hypothetical protein [Bradyrhizobium yuanmingense]MDF0517737.1 hypothetical protein [Bradyrhizobium yuanmingense]
MSGNSENNFPIGIRIPDSRRAALERAAAMRGLSVASFVELLVDRALAEAEAQKSAVGG